MVVEINVLEIGQTCMYSLCKSNRLCAI